MTWDDQLGRKVGHVEAEELAYRRRMIAVSDQERTAILRAIDERGLHVVIDEIASWVRQVVTDPDDDRATAPIGAMLQAQWRVNARSLRTDGYRRPADAARHVRELLRHDLDLRARRVLTPKGMDGPVVDDLLRRTADFTAEQLADVAGLRWPPRTRTHRPRRRTEPAPPARAPIDPVQRQRDRDAYDRETLAWQKRRFEEQQRRILEDPDA